MKIEAEPSTPSNKIESNPITIKVSADLLKQINAKIEPEKGLSKEDIKSDFKENNSLKKQVTFATTIEEVKN
jgi:hypothetical protein